MPSKVVEVSSNQVSFLLTAILVVLLIWLLLWIVANFPRRSGNSASFAGSSPAKTLGSQGLQPQNGLKTEFTSDGRVRGRYDIPSGGVR